MRIDQFQTSSPGKLVSIKGLPSITHAFVPDPLPPKWSWPQRLWPLLMEAHKALASLDGTGRHLPNSRLLLRPLQSREAVRSSNLEGTYTDPRQQALFELEPRYPASADDPVNAQREVFNYSRALRLKKSNNDLPISLRLIRNLHSVLMEGVRGSDSDPGNFRRLQNQVGRPARYVPPPANMLDPLLDQFEKYLHADHGLDPLVEAFLVHYQFEAIHPFMDGNGRVGRLLLAILIEEWCGLSDQWLYMSPYFDSNRDTYVDLLLRVSTQAAWEEWIEFCLRGVVDQAIDSRRRCAKLLSLQSDFDKRLAEIGGSVRLASIVNGLFKTPVARVSRMADKLGVSYPTARDDLRKLEGAGILSRVDGASPITYACMPILDVIYEDIEEIG